jgi:hypothetical protein
LRKLASRLYTRNLKDTPEQIVKRNLWQIGAGYFPGALIADRTALETAPARDGSICLISERAADVNLPGLVLRPLRGIGPQPTDRHFISGLFLCSPARAYLENMRQSRAHGGRIPRTLTRKELEERLDAFVRRNGDEGVNRLRDDMRALAPALGLEAETKVLDALIGTLLGTQEAKLVSPVGRARHAQRPYDPDMLELFQVLHHALREHYPAPICVRQRTAAGLATCAFFEAYFSNFIEGTEFEVDETMEIVFEGIIPTDRPADAHDVLGTWRIVSDTEEMSRLPKEAGEFVSLLRGRHAVIMEGRPDKGPGIFKTGANRVGASHFVAPDLVEGTLDHGFALSRSLDAPLQRAIFIMFLVAEVHPFADGNGRVARIMMNAELVAAGEERIIIPTVYRNNYLAALRALTHNREPEPIMRALGYAQRWTHAIPWGSIEKARQVMEACNAFHDPNLADREGIRLQMPRSKPEPST